MKINKLLLDALGVESPDSEVLVSGVSCDTREMKGGEIFCSISGNNLNGRDFVDEAIQKGAACLIADESLNLSSDILQIKVDNVRAAMAQLACEFEGHPAKELCMVGITGTNGKTTTTNIIAQISNQNSKTIGTLNANSHLTTPNSPYLQAQLRSYLNKGVELVAMEVSSHGLAQHRVDGIKFKVSVFLNLSQDHLDYHTDFKDYFSQKAKLFDSERSEIAVICSDDKWGQELLSQRPDAISFSLGEVDIVDSNQISSKFIWKGRECILNMPGLHNVSNSVAALESLSALDEDMDLCIKKLAKISPIAGRFEIIPGNKKSGTVIVDYAHSPAALETALKSARTITDSKIILVFGCGGERDKQKRPQMGEIGSQLADLIILTSDNSRNEDTQKIIDDILKGMKTSEVKVEIDRAEAIKLAITASTPNDVVLIAGKGHENIQISKQGAVSFSDAEIAKTILRKMK